MFQAFDAEEPSVEAFEVSNNLTDIEITGRSPQEGAYTLPLELSKLQSYTPLA